MTWIIANWRSLALVAIATLISALSYQAGQDRVQSKWNAEKLLQAQQIAIANAKAQAIERKAQETLVQKQKELEDEKRKTELAIDNAAAIDKRMSNTVAALKAKLSNTAGSASAFNENDLARSWTLLEDCTGKYTEVSRVADIQRDDLAEWQAYGETINQFREDVKKLENVKSKFFVK